MRSLKTAVVAAAVMTLACHASVRAAAWNATSGGDWSNTAATGWNGPSPNAIDAVATINTNITASQIMNLDVSAIVGSMTLGDLSGTSTWTLQDTGAFGRSLTFDVSSGNASLTSVGGANTISVPIAIDDLLDLTASSNITLSGALSGGAVGINKSGTGTLTLSGADANTYTGLTTVSAGTLTLNKTLASAVNAIGGSLTINGGSVGYNSTNKSNQIADGATVTLGGGTINFTVASQSETIQDLTVNSGTFNLGTSNNGGSTFTASGTTTLAGGTFNLRTNASANTFSTGGLTISGGANTVESENGAIGVMTMNVNGPTTINQPHSGAFTALTIRHNRIDLGSGTTVNLLGDLTFNADASNTASVTIASVASGNRIPLISLGTTTRTWTIGDGAASADLVIQPTITGGAGGALTKAGAGTLRFDGVNIYTGATTLTAGVVIDNATVAASSQSGTRTNASTTITGLSDTNGLKVGQAVTATGIGSNARIASIVDATTIRLTVGASSSGSTNFNFSAGGGVPGGLGVTGGLSNLIFNGGVLGLGSGNFARALGTTAAQTQFTGDGGFAAFGVDRSVNIGGSSGAVTWNSGSFIPAGSKLILGADNADATVDFQNPINLAGDVRTVEVDNGSALIDARLSGVLSNGGLTKTGAGTLQLDAINTYAGNTTVNDGTLVLAEDAKLTFLIGNSGANNAILGTGTVRLAGEFAFDLSGAATAPESAWQIVDVAALSSVVFGSSFAVSGFAETSAGIWTLDDYRFTESTGRLTVVPEPATMWALALGVVTLLGRRQRG